MSMMNLEKEKDEMNQIFTRKESPSNRFLTNKFHTVVENSSR